MGTLPPSNEEDLDLLVAYSPDDEEETVEAVVNAFLAANVDVSAKPTVLRDWINTDVFEDVPWSNGHPLSLRARIWDRRVVVTPDEVRIYAASPVR